MKVDNIDSLRDLSSDLDFRFAQVEQEAAEDNLYITIPLIVTKPNYTALRDAAERSLKNNPDALRYMYRFVQFVLMSIEHELWIDHD